MSSFQQFTQRAKEAFRIAQEHAIENGNQNISPLHLFIALVSQEEGLVQPILLRIDVDPYSVYNSALKILQSRSSTINTESTPVVQLYPTPELAVVLEHSGKIASAMKEKYISTEHLFLAILEKPGILKSVLEEFDINSEKITNTLINLKEDKFVTNDARAKNIEKYGRNLTQLAKEKKLDPVIGREEEINRVIQIISRRTKNNPLLIGEPGTGKTAIAEGLAQRIVVGDVPESMKNKQIFNLDIVSMLAGTKFRGEFEERLKKLMKEVENDNDKYILFIDEVHSLVGAGSVDGTMDAANILKPALARGDLRLIGATTLKEYQKYIEKDGALTRRFQSVYVKEPSVEDTISILRGLKQRYEIFHGIRITDDAIVAAAKLSKRYITDRFLPDKAIDLIDEAASLIRVSIENKPPELNKAHKKIMQYEIELQALKKDYELNKDLSIKKRITKIEKDTATKKESTKKLEIRWKNEKDTIEQLKVLQSKLEQLKQKGEEMESVASYDKAAEIRYIDVPKLENEFKKTKSKLKRLQSNRKILKEQVTEEEITNVISSWTGIHASKMIENEMKKLNKMEKEIKKSIIGQDEAIEKIAFAIKRSRVGISNSKRPIGSFLFLGPTGVGKTELAKQLANYIFDDEKSLVRFDMSEYMDKHSVSKFIGAPPGYVGYEEAGKLTEAVRYRPYSIILFDEIEKAHPDIFNILLQVLDDGHLTDGKGRFVNFKNTIIILTSNVGSRELANINTVGFESYENKIKKYQDAYNYIKDKVMSKVQKMFNPEFINRLDEIIIFRPLTMENIKSITKIVTDEALSELKEKEIYIDIEKSVYMKIAKDGYSEKYGARQLRRKVQTDILNPLANMIISGEVTKGTKINISLKNDKFVFEAKKHKKREKIAA